MYSPGYADQTYSPRKLRDIKDIAKDVRRELKKVFPECKFSVTIDRFAGGQSMGVSLMAAPFDPFASESVYHDRGYAQLNRHTFKARNIQEDGTLQSNGAHLTKQAVKVLYKVIQIANQDNWNHSDSMIDYFDVNYYFDIEIGKWNRPFEQTA